jgi:hypothetical protein
MLKAFWILSILKMMKMSRAAARQASLNDGQAAWA